MNKAKKTIIEKKPSNKYEITREVIKEYIKENPGIENFTMVAFTFWIGGRVQKINNQKICN